MAWTTIDFDTSWQDLAVAQEIAAAYNQRRAVCGLSAIATPDQSTAVYDFLYAIQSGIEAMSTYFANPSLGDNVSGLMSNFTLSQAMTYAGLTVNGYWRRIADGGSQPAAWTDYGASGWAYGKIQSKDLAGPWLWKDIQLALSALTRRLHAASLTNPPAAYACAQNGAQDDVLLSAYPPSITGTIASNGSYSEDAFGFAGAFFAEQYELPGPVVRVETAWSASAQRGYASISGLTTALHRVRLLLRLNTLTGDPYVYGLRYASGSLTVGYRYFSDAETWNSTSDSELLVVLDRWEGKTWSDLALAMADWPPKPLTTGVQYADSAQCFFDTAAQWVIDYTFWD